MASLSAILPSPLLTNARKTLFKTLHKLPVSPIREKERRYAFVVKASGENSESATSLSITKSVQNVWDSPEDRLGVIGLSFAAVVAFWTSINIITFVDNLPLFPSVLEAVGVLFSAWFTYRYLLFKPDREELFQTINKSVSDVLGQ